jgi:hypothetical protein
MKKLLSIALISGIAFGAHAQDKKFRAGLVTGFTINSTKVNSKKIEKNGAGAGFTIGMAGEYNLNENIAIASGLQFDLESFKLNYGSTTNSSLGNVFYGYSDTDIKKYKDGAFEEFSDTTMFELETRKFKAKYVTLPIFLKFQTNMIGSFKYYGKFGVRASFLAGVRMDDTGYDAALLSDGNFERTASATRTNLNMKPLGLKKGLSPVRMGVGIYGGAEWNFTGNTFLFAEAGFNYGITPNLYPTSGHLVDSEKIGNNGQGSGSDNLFQPVNNLDIKSNPQHIFELKVGLLF